MAGVDGGFAVLTGATAKVGSDMLPITASQQGLLMVHGRATGKPVYNMLVRFDLDPACAPEAVEAALAAMVHMQPAMRQVFGVLPYMHARLTAPVDALPIERVVVPAVDFEDAIADTCRRIGRPEFDLENGPAYRFATVRAEDGSASAILLADHHIILDGLSLGPMVGDLERMLTVGMPPEEIAALAESREAAYRRELQAQERAANSPEAAERAKVWAARLREVPPLILAPRPGRPTQTAFTGARVQWLLDPQEAETLGELCRRLDINPFVVFTGIYGAVLARHGNVSTVMIGSPFLARRTVRAFDLCGFFVNTLPVTVDVDWSRPVADYLAADVSEAVNHCRSNQDISFTQLVAEARPDRTSNRNPLFSAMLAMQDTFVPRPEGRGPIHRISEPGNDTAKFDLWLGATPAGSGWLLELEYDQELIAPAVADGLLGSLRTALRRALDDSSRSVADLFVDASAAVSTRSDGWRSRLPAPTLLDAIEAVAARQPSAVAVEEPSRSLTYADLVRDAARTASALAARGIGPDDVVGLAADTLADTVVSILAIMRRGATFLPLDESLPADRLAYMTRKVSCPLIVGRGLVPDVPAVPIGELVDSEPGGSVASPDAAVYVMFTSGSTGAPKGVRMGHDWLAALAAWQVDVMRMDRDTRFLQYAPLGFDVCFQEIVPTLIAGGTVVSRAPADRRDFPAVLRRIAQTEVTHVYLPVAALRPVAQLAVDRGIRLPHLRYLCVSGEQLLVDEQVREFFVRHPHCRLINHYGPTESQAVTTFQLSAADPVWPTHVPIGVPLPDVAAYVVDVTGHLAPSGVPGELFLGGRCPAQGYVNEPGLTAARFIPDRFAPPGADLGGRGVMYRTGDLVVRNERDELVFLGRLDTQVKIRGHRVELGEIEVVANRVLGVRQALAVVNGDGADRELALFLLPHAGADVDPERVREHLAATLPAYMRPRWIFAIDAIPTTRTGKTDREALLRLVDEMLAQRESDGAGHAPPADELERELAAVWERLLGVESIARDRPVLEYGANSLNIFAALAEIQQAQGVPVPIGEFFASPTVAALASLIRAAREAA